MNSFFALPSGEQIEPLFRAAWPAARQQHHDRIGHARRIGKASNSCWRQNQAKPQSHTRIAAATSRASQRQYRPSLPHRAPHGIRVSRRKRGDPRRNHRDHPGDSAPPPIATTPEPPIAKQPDCGPTPGCDGMMPTMAINVTRAAASTDCGRRAGHGAGASAWKGRATSASEAPIR